MARRRKRPTIDADSGKDRQLLYVSPQEIAGGMIRERAAQDAQQLAPLAASIARHGVLSPLIVRREEGFYRLICGARRLAACKLLGMKTVPILVIEADEAQAAAVFMEEHLCRVSPCAIDEARAVRGSGGMEAASESVLGETVFFRRLALLSLDEKTLRIVRDGALSLEQAEPLLSVLRPDLRQEAARLIAERGLGGVQARRLVFGARREETRSSTANS